MMMKKGDEIDVRRYLYKEALNSLSRGRCKAHTVCWDTEKNPRELTSLQCRLYRVSLLSNTLAVSRTGSPVISILRIQLSKRIFCLVELVMKVTCKKGKFKKKWRETDEALPTQSTSVVVRCLEKLTRFLKAIFNNY